jgi:hypothetical protein
VEIPDIGKCLFRKLWVDPVLDENPVRQYRLCRGGKVRSHNLIPAGEKNMRSPGVRVSVSRQTRQMGFAGIVREGIRATQRLRGIAVRRGAAADTLGLRITIGDAQEAVQPRTRRSGTGRSVRRRWRALRLLEGSAPVVCDPTDSMTLWPPG